MLLKSFELFRESIFLLRFETIGDPLNVIDIYFFCSWFMYRD